MKQFIKNLFTILLLLPLFMSISCKKFLDRKPLGVATEGDITQGGLEGKVFGLYGALRNDNMTGFPMLFFKSIRSDDAQKGSTSGDLADAGAIMEEFGQYSKDHWLLNGYWDGHYEFIALCNDVIHDIDSLKLTDPASQVNMGEAKFMRAYAYFDLVRDYGEVPLINFKVVKTSEADKPKSTVPQVYAQIDADLQAAAQTLPLNWEAKYVSRVTKGTANALMAKTMLYRQNWAGALAKADEVISSGQYDLYKSSTRFHPYFEFFTEAGENSKESLLEVQNYSNANGSIKYNNNHNEVQGVRGSGEWDLGWGFNVPTINLIASYEPGDPRETSTILYSGKPDSSYGRTVPPSPPLAQPYWNKKVYSDPARRLATGDLHAPWLNVRLLRYADVLLMAAEAANEIGGAANTTKALAYIEMIRSRARNGNNSILPPVTLTDQGQFRTAIQKERRAEMAMEYDRFYDLVRWGLAESVFGSAGYKPRNRYYPIPQTAIDKSGGILKQNPDY